MNLGCGLWTELRGSGIDVLAVCPGMTDTRPVQDRKLAEDLPFYIPLTGPEPVAWSSLRRLGKQPALVPNFVETGEMIKIDTRTGEYIERVKE